MADVWLAPASISVAAFVLYRLQQKKLASKYKPIELSFAMNFIPALVALPLSIVLFWWFGLDFPTDAGAALGISILANIGGAILLFRSFALEDISVVVPLTGITPIMVALLEPLVSTAEYAPKLIVAAGLSAVGVYITLIENEDLLTPLYRLRSTGPKLAVLSAVTFSFANLSDHYAVQDVGSFRYTGVLFACLALAFGAILIFKDNQFSKAPSTLLSRELLALGAFRMAFVYAVFAAFALASATRVTIFTQITPPLTVLIGNRIFREDYLVRRLVGALVLSVAVYLTI